MRVQIPSGLPSAFKNPESCGCICHRAGVHLNITTMENTDLFAEVRPGGSLGKMLDSISNHRKHRWKAYLRACKKIPATSPVAGSTSFQRINGRRHELITEYHTREDYEGLKASLEYRAVSTATSQWLCGPLVAENFLLGRLLRRMQRKLKKPA